MMADNAGIKAAMSACGNVNSAPCSPQKQKRRRAHFPSELVTKTIPAPDYDRTALLADIFRCDVCGLVIPFGLKGFEPFATCTNEESCVDGFDMCGKCCGAEEIMRICRETKYSPDNDNNPGTILVQNHHPHKLQVVDRRAEVLWANEGAVRVVSTTSNETSPVPSKSPRRKREPKSSGKRKVRKVGN